MSDNSTHIPPDYEAYYDYNSTSYSPCTVDLIEFGKVFLPTLYSLVFIVGFVGNGIVVCVLVKHRNQTKLTDICLCNLALSDLLFLFTLPFYAHLSVVGYWPFGSFMCRFLSTCHFTGFFSSTFFMVVMTLDRYVVIMHAHRVAKHRTLRAGMVLSGLVWLTSICVSLPAFIFPSGMDGNHTQACYYDRGGGWDVYEILTKNILGLGIPLLVMVVCYSRIIPTLVNMRSAKKHRVLKLIISIVVAFFLFWAPYNIVLVLQYLQFTCQLLTHGTFDTNLNLSLIVTEAIAYTHCCLNPIIYAFVGQKFKRRATQLLRNWVPGNFQHTSTRDLSNSSCRQSSVMSRSSDVTSTVIM